MTRSVAFMIYYEVSPNPWQQDCWTHNSLASLLLAQFLREMLVLPTSFLAFVRCEESSKRIGVCAALTSRRIDHTLVAMTLPTRRATKLWVVWRRISTTTAPGWGHCWNYSSNPSCAWENGTVVSHMNTMTDSDGKCTVEYAPPGKSVWLWSKTNMALLMWKIQTTVGTRPECNFGWLDWIWHCKHWVG